MYEPIDYSTVNVEKSTVSEDLDGIHAFNFEFMEQIPSRFANGGPKDETHFKRAFVHVSIDSDLRAMKFNVDLLGLPSPVLDDGNEVLVQFHVEDLEQQKTFYTDSNGLEMQQRILNYRPTFDLTDYYKKENVTTNYYPITSAIAIKDPDNGKALTVMNDKTQGGSSLRVGTVELM